MAALTNYTSTEAVIGAIGITDNEIEPEMLTEQHLDKALLVDLYDWLPSHATVWDAAAASSPSAEAEIQGHLLQLYSTWFCAAYAAKMWLAMPQRISDGKTDMRRFASLDLEAIAENAAVKAGAYKTKLQKLIDPTHEATTVTPIVIATPKYDPVTGTES